MTPASLASPIVVDAGEKDVGQLAATIARIVAGEVRRLQFQARFVELHARHAAGEPSAGGEIWTLAQQALTRALRGWALAQGHADRDDAVPDAITDAVLTALRLEPRQAAQIRDIDAWLWRCSQNRLRDSWRRVRARPDLGATWLDDELGHQAANLGRASTDFDDPIERADAGRRFHSRWRAKCWNPREMRLVRLRYLQQAPVDEQAAVVGAAHLPYREQLALLNRWIKRIAARPESRHGKSGRRRGVT